MVMVNPHKQEPLRMTEAEYLAFQEKSDIRYEFVSGKVYAMAGADWKHVMITQSTSVALYNQLAGKSCFVATSDLRLKVTSKKVSYRYPDLMVICGSPRFVDGRQDTINNPIVIIEVLLPSTALEDRNAKLEEYTSIESVQEYLLISQDDIKIERFKRHQAGEWLYTSVTGLEAQLEINSIDCVLTLASVYEKVNE